MPGFDATGPRGMGPMTGRGFGRCRPASQTDSQQTTETEGAAPAAQQPIVYGVGRGGAPRGCGMGNCGGRRRRCW